VEPGGGIDAVARLASGEGVPVEEGSEAWSGVANFQEIAMVRLCGVVLLTFFMLTCSVRAQDQALVFGILNQQSPQLTAERWNPIFAYLGGVTGYRFQLRMGPNVQATNAMMAKGEFDLVFTNHNFRPEYDGTYKVIARWGNAPIFGVIAVLGGSRFTRLKDLSGLRIAYPSQNAFVAYAVPKAALRRAGIAEKEVLAGNQEGALAQLASGQVEAAAVNSRFLTQYAARTGLRYREIYTSEPYPDLAVLAHPRLTPEQLDRIQAALVGMSTDPKALPLLEANQFPGFFPANEKDYDGVRRAYRALGN
jgi:phosphonate transport system substrate-binding protein